MGIGKTKRTQKKIGIWQRVALGWDEFQNLKVARIGDNMRQVAVTEGDKVEAQIRFGFSVNGYDSSDVVKHINAVSDSDLNNLLKNMKNLMNLTDSLKDGADKRAILS